MTQGVICMAVYRPDPSLLRRQLQSLQSQTLQDWTCIVGIDGRDPTVFRLLQEFVREDKRFKLIEFEHNVGFYRNFERIVAMAVGASWVALADQDDYWYPDKLSTLVSRLGRGGVLAVSAQARVIDESGRELASTTRRSTGLRGTMIDNQLTGSLAVVAGEVISASVPFPPPTDAAYHDHWLAVLALVLGSIEMLDERMQDYVQHDSNVLGEHGRRSLLGRLLGNVRRRVGPRHLATHRWNWRVTMATWARHRLGVSNEQLDLFSKGHITPQLLSNTFAAVARREAPVGRSAALLVGAAFWREADRAIPPLESAGAELSEQ